MTEQQMPARIWAGSGYDMRFWQKCKPDELADSVCQTEFVRSDIAERMAEALEKAVKLARLAEGLASCSSDDEYVWGLQNEFNSALSAFRPATQDTEARHD